MNVKASPVGSFFETPLLAVDWDPAAAYRIAYNITVRRGTTNYFDKY